MSTDDGDRHDSDFAGTLLGGSQEQSDPPEVVVERTRRADRHRPSRNRRRRRNLIPLISLLVVAALCVAGYVIVRKVADGFSTKDYAGEGTGIVLIQVKSGDSSSEIGSTLKDEGVVASQQAFIDAARDSGRSEEFQPGYFNLRKQMSAKSAVALLLDPTARVSTKVTIPEGSIEPQVLALLATKLKLAPADLQAASKDIANLGLPDGFKAASAEGFLFPSTYQFDPNLSASDVLQQLTSQFDTEVRKLNFNADAAKLKITPYQALIIASMVEAEVKFDGDRAKVARVVYNRLAAKMALGFDTTTAYDYKIHGKDPTKATYTENSPYNTRNRLGLPPTPIGNPGEKSMIAAVEPAPGNWLYFVSADAAGHLVFTNDYEKFQADSEKCRVNKWGCT